MKKITLFIIGFLSAIQQTAEGQAFGFVLESRLADPGGPIRSLIFTQDGKGFLAAAGGRLKAFAIDGTEPPRIVGVFQIPRREILGIAVSPDGKSLALVDDGGSLSLLNLTSLQTISTVLKAHVSRATCVTFSDDGAYVITGGHDGKVRVWTLQGESFAELSQGARHAGEVTMVAALPGRQLLSVGRDRNVILWKIDTQQALRPMSVESDVRAAAVGGDGKTLALGLQTIAGNRFRSAKPGSLSHSIDADDRLRLIDASNGTQMRDIPGERQDLDTVGVTPDGRFVAAGGSGKSTAIWDTATGQRVTNLPAEAPVTAIAFSPDGARMVTGGRDGSVAVYRLSGVGPAARPGPPATIIVIVLEPSSLVDERGAPRGEPPKVRSTSLRLRGKIKTNAPIKSILVDGQEITSIQPSGDGDYLFNASIPIPQPGQRRFEIVAENVQGAIARQSFLVDRTPEAAAPALGEGRRLALVIGISDYADPKLDLQYADKDAQAMYEFLTNPALGPAAFRQEDVKLLLNQEATAAAINTGLRDFLQKARENDFVLFFFAGHGAPDRNRIRDLYLLAYDTDSENVAGTGLLMRHVRDAIGEIPARDVLVLADACHSAGIAVSGDTRSVTENPIHQTFLEKMRHSSGGLAVLTASEAAQLALEHSQWAGHGVFTYFLLEGLKGAADINRDHIVATGELIEFVRDKVRDATRYQQIPSVSPTSFDRQLPLAIVPSSDPSNPKP